MAKKATRRPKKAVAAKAKPTKRRQPKAKPAEPKPPEAKPAIAATEEEAAEALKISDRQLRRWKRREGFPAIANGYDVAAIDQWRQLMDLKGSAGDADAKEVKLAREELRLEELEIKVAALRREEQREIGEILPRREYELYVRECQQKARDHLLRLPKLLCAEMPKDTHKTLQHEARLAIENVLKELARDLEQGPDAKDLQAAAGTGKRKRKTRTK